MAIGGRKMKRKFLITYILIIILITFNYANTHKIQTNIQRSEGLIERAKIESQEDIADSLIRFHVLANSDSKQDQETKLRVRDEVLKEVVPYFEKSQSLQETRRIINEKQENIIDIAKKVLKESGKNYGVTATLGNFSFPTKYYGNFSLPAGNYEAFRIVLGEGKGSNWWCVMFPPLCFINVEKEEGSIQVQDDEKLENLIEPAARLENTDTIQEESIIEKEPEPVKVRWKFLELFQSIFNKNK
jgi:stage II sporulation protein R